MEQGTGYNEIGEGVEKSLGRKKEDAEQREGEGCPEVLRFH